MKLYNYLVIILGTRIAATNSSIFDVFDPKKNFWVGLFFVIVFILVDLFCLYAGKNPKLKPIAIVVFIIFFIFAMLFISFNR